MSTEKKTDKSLLGSQTVATTDKKELGPVAQRAEGTENISAEDVQLARYRLIQVTSAEAESGTNKPGTIKNSLTEATYDKVQLILLTMFKNRVLFDKDNTRGGPICRSFDMLSGSGCECGCEDNCKACEYNKGFPTQCNVLYNYPCISIEQVGKEALPSVLSFMKSSIPVAMKINASVIGKIPAQPFYFYVWEIGSKKKEYKQNKSAFVYTAQIVRETTEEERSWASMVYDMFLKNKSAANQKIAEAVIEHEEE